MRPIYTRAITEKERETLRSELKSGKGVVVRRSHVILMSADEGLKAQVIAERVGYSDETVRQVIQQFNKSGLLAIYPKAYGRHDDQRAFNDAARDQLKAIVRQSPRDFGCESSMWILAEVSYQEGLTDRIVHLDTMSETLSQIGVNWKKAKRHIQSPDEHYGRKKNEARG